MAYEDKFGMIRPVCPQCEWIHFVNPKVAAAVLIEKAVELKSRIDGGDAADRSLREPEQNSGFRRPARGRP